MIQLKTDEWSGESLTALFYFKKTRKIGIYAEKPGPYHQKIDEHIKGFDGYMWQLTHISSTNQRNFGAITNI